MRQKKLQREETILLLLSKFDYLTRNQIQRLMDIDGDRNARRILTNLKPFLGAFRGERGEYIYYLSKAGREATGADKVRNKTTQAGHYLMRNDTFIYYRGNGDWMNEMRFHVDKVVTVITDAYFIFNLKRHFLEVDHLQHMNKNKEKVDRYKKLKETGVLQKRIGYFPALVWVTLTEARKKQLLEWCSGMDVTVHLWDDIK